MPRIGRVVALCISEVGNVPKYPHEMITVGEFGFVGDFHAGKTRISRTTGQPKPNDRQVSLVAKEVLDNLSQELALELKPGDLGENITTEGLGNLADIPNGWSIKIGETVILEVTKQNDPCNNLSVYHRLMVKSSYGRRGLLATVVGGAGTVLRPGATIEIV